MLKTENKKYKNQSLINYKFSLSNPLITHLGCLEEEITKNIPVLKFLSKDSYFSEIINGFNPIFTMLKYGDLILHPKFIKPIKHLQSLNLDENILIRETTYNIDNVNINIFSEKFLDSEKSIIYHRYTFKADSEVEINLYHGIEDVNYGSDLEIIKITSGDHEKLIQAKTNNNIKINNMLIYEKNFRHKNHNKLNQSLEHYSITTKTNREYTIIHYAGVFNDNEKKSRKQLKKQRNKGYDILKENHKLEWNNKFSKYKLQIINNYKFNFLANFSIFQLLSKSPNAKGLVYNDFIGFKWLNDVFVARFYLNNAPELTRKIIKQRIESLIFAKEIAQTYHYNGALYLDNPNAFNQGNRQLYLNGIIAHSLDIYFNKTKDMTILSDGGLLMLIEICHFYASYAKLSDSQTRYDILNVSNIDNTLQNINNHSLTNYLIKNSFRILFDYIKIFKMYDKKKYGNILKYNNLEGALKEIKKVNKKLYYRKENANHLIQIYQGFFYDLDNNKLSVENERLNFTNDVLLMFILFPEEFSEHIKQKNKDFHRESFIDDNLNKLFGSLVATNIVDEKAYTDILEVTDLNKNSIYINELGLNIGCAGMIYYYLIYHLAKLRCYNDILTADSLIPQDIRRLEFSINYLGKLAEVKIKRNSARIEWNKF
ncbi:MAG: hypothetical protein K9L64_03880 [Candidatus Izimaplasma sp.]|nr:hypothetical protein [Candidatus Izimaplasma bacterium]